MKNQINYSKKSIIYNTLRKLAWAYNWDMDINYLNNFGMKYKLF